jgi:hypothetical protein
MTTQDKFLFIKSVVVHPYLCKYVTYEGEYFISGNTMEEVEKKRNNIKRKRVGKYYKIEDMYDEITRDYPFTHHKGIKKGFYFKSNIPKVKYLDEENEVSESFPFSPTG